MDLPIYYIKKGSAFFLVKNVVCYISGLTSWTTIFQSCQDILAIAT